MMEIGTALTDPKVFEPWFSGPSWDGWKAVLRAAFAEKMTKAEADFFRTVASREPPGQRMRELWVIAGRRCGKDFDRVRHRGPRGRIVRPGCQQAASW